MSLERDAKQILHHLESSTHDVWGDHARNLAHGIDKSGVPALLRGIASDQREQVAASNRIESAVRESVGATAALAAVNAAGFASICSAIGMQTSVLHSIEELLANPLSTAASERYRRGVRALSQGWVDDAAREFGAAIDDDPYLALAHFGLGLSLGAQSDYAGAERSFASAIKYGSVDDALNPIVAGAALLAAQAADQIAHHDAAREFCLSGLRRVPDCAELLLASAKRGAADAQLSEALTLAPELAVLAVATDVPHARSIAESVAAAEHGPIRSMQRAAEIYAEAGGPQDLRVPDESPAAMTHHSWWSQHGVAEVRRFASWLQTEKANLEQEITAAESQARGKAPRRKGVNGPTTLVLFIVCVAIAIASGVKSAAGFNSGGASALLLWIGWAAPMTLFGFIAFCFLFSISGAFQADSHHRAQLASYYARVRAAKISRDAARPQLEKVNDGLALAPAMQRAADASVRSRTLPLLGLTQSRP